MYQSFPALTGSLKDYIQNADTGTVLAIDYGQYIFRLLVITYLAHFLPFSLQAKMVMTVCSTSLLKMYVTQGHSHVWRHEGVKLGCHRKLALSSPKVTAQMWVIVKINPESENSVYKFLNASGGYYIDLDPDDGTSIL